jgi:hypothetical protein
MTCNDCGREIGDCDRNGCREVHGTAWGDWGDWALAMAKTEPDGDITAGVESSQSDAAGDTK